MTFSDLLRAGDEPAWETMMEFAQLPSVYARRLGVDDPDGVAGDAWLRLWQAIAQGASMPTSGHAINYWRQIARAAAIDARRHLSSAAGVVHQGEPIDRVAWRVAAPHTPEQAAIIAEERAALWGRVAARLTTPALRVAAGTLAIGLRASEVAAHWPHLFADAAAVSLARKEATKALARPSRAESDDARRADFLARLAPALELRAQGLSDAEIAARLGMPGPRTPRQMFVRARSIGIEVPPATRHKEAA